MWGHAWCSPWWWLCLRWLRSHSRHCGSGCPRWSTQPRERPCWGWPCWPDDWPCRWSLQHQQCQHYHTTQCTPLTPHTTHTTHHSSSDLTHCNHTVTISLHYSSGLLTNILQIIMNKHGFETYFETYFMSNAGHVTCREVHRPWINICRFLQGVTGTWQWCATENYSSKLINVEIWAKRPWSPLDYIIILVSHSGTTHGMSIQN